MLSKYISHHCCIKKVTPFFHIPLVKFQGSNYIFMKMFSKCNASYFKNKTIKVCFLSHMKQFIYINNIYIYSEEKKTDLYFYKFWLMVFFHKKKENSNPTSPPACPLCFVYKESQYSLLTTCFHLCQSPSLDDTFFYMSISFSLLVFWSPCVAQP